MAIRTISDPPGARQIVEKVVYFGNSGRRSRAKYVNRPRRIARKHANDVALLAMSFLAPPCFGESAPKSKSLCMFQKEVREASHATVQFSGALSEGLGLGTLRNPACREETTWVELALRKNKNKEKLRGILEHSSTHQASVVFEGEFFLWYTSARPKVAGSDWRSYHPNGGHLNCCRTKRVVRAVGSVKASPAC